MPTDIITFPSPYRQEQLYTPRLMKHSVRNLSLQRGSFTDKRSGRDL